MHTRTHKWFLVMITLALAVAPLRGTWAISTSATADNTSHCGQMEMQTADVPAGMQQQDSANETGHECEPDCTGACCDGACNACAHGTSTLSDTVITTLKLHDTPLDEIVLVSFPERTVIPPLRPPASL